MEIRKFKKLLVANRSEIAIRVCRAAHELGIRTVGLQDTNDFSLDANCESLWEKMIGKPCAGKLHVRFDEGELEIEHG